MSKNIQIGVNTLFLIPGEVGGTETYLVEMLAGMLRSDKTPQLTLFTNRENDELLRNRFGGHSGVKLIATNVVATNRPARIVCEQIILPYLASKNSIDVLWSPGYTGPLFTTCPRAVTVHDMQYKRFSDDFSLASLLAVKLIVGLSIRRSTAVFTISEFAKSEILRFSSKKACDVQVFLEAANPVFANQMEESLRLRLTKAVSGGHQYILCVANSYPHKNIHMLIEAFGLLACHADTRLIIVGKPRLGEDRIHAALQEIPNSRNVIRLERVEPDTLIALYQGAALFAFPSLYEGFGLPVLEALSAGAIVVTTRSSAIPEVAGEGVIYSADTSATTFAEALEYGLSLSADQVSERRNYAITRAKSFSWDEASGKMIEAFEQLAGL